MKALGVAVFAAVLFASPLAAQESLSPTPVLHFDNSAGAPLSGGKLFTYQAGTTTKQNTYTTSSGMTANQNPTILNTRGEANVWLDPTKFYKFVLSPSTDSDPPTNPIYTVDNIFANASGGGSGGQNTGAVVTTSTSILSAIETISVNASGSTTQTLPASPVLWERHTIVDGAGNAAAFPITVAGNGNTIGGQANYFLTSNRQSIDVQWDGAQWNVAAENPADIPAIASIANLRKIPVAAAPLYANLTVSDYYGTGTGCPISYHWNASDSTTDNGGSVINPTGNAGNGRWDLNQSPRSPVHTCTFGVKLDGTTDNSTQLQAALTWAHTSGSNRVHIDGFSSGGQTRCANFGTTLSVPEGEIVEGDGEGTAVSGDWGTTCLNFTNTTGWGLQTLSVQSGIGTTPFESPKFRDFVMYTPNSTTAGGCIRLNTIAGGFTDDNTSQQAMIHPEIRNVLCYMGFITNNGQIGIQMSKAVDGTIFHSDTYNGLTGIDLEGSDNIAIGGGCRVTNTYGSTVKFVSHGTFGNNDTIQDCQLLLLADTGAGQAIDSQLFDGARSSTISNVFFEGAAPAGGSLASTIHLSGGFTAGVHDNDLTTTSTNSILKDGIYNNITVINNGTAGGTLNQVRINDGNYFFNSSGLQQTLVHYGNGQNVDAGWSYNTKSVKDIPFTSNVVNIFTPSYEGLTYTAQGTTEIPANNAWTFPLTGSTNYLDWRGIIQGPARTGTFDSQVFAYQPGGGTINCVITDSGVPVAGGYTAQVVTATPVWYTLANAQVVATDGGVRCYSASAGLIAIQINMVKH